MRSDQRITLNILFIYLLGLRHDHISAHFPGLRMQLTNSILQQSHINALKVRVRERSLTGLEVVQSLYLVPKLVELALCEIGALWRLRATLPMLVTAVVELHGAQCDDPLRPPEQIIAAVVFLLAPALLLLDTLELLDHLERLAHLHERLLVLLVALLALRAKLRQAVVEGLQLNLVLL